MGFKSRVFCVPERSVEAVAGPRGRRRMVEVGKGEGQLLAHYEGFTKEEEEEEAGDFDTGGAFTSLMARWTLRQLPYNSSPFPSTSAGGEEGMLLAQHVGEPVRTGVDLAIELEFTNPAYATLSQAAAPKMADIMIEAFEKRTRSLLIGKE